MPNSTGSPAASPGRGHPAGGSPHGRRRVQHQALRRRFLDAANAAAGGRHRFSYFEAKLTRATAVLAGGAVAACLFVNDQADDAALGEFAAAGVRLVALRSAGFNNVDLAAARRLGLAVARVPAYSPDAVAEHTVAMILSLNRGIHRAYARVREGNLALKGCSAST